MSSTPLVSRFAPSPTGHLHLGNARTALLNYLAARKSGGRFILRVVDNEESRSSNGFMQELVKDLRWLGLEWDEGPDIGGPHDAYRQHERREIYETWLAKLEALGMTYPCFCTPAELNASRRQQHAAGHQPRYSGVCRNLTEAQRCERLVRGLPAAVRFAVPAGKGVAFIDLVKGEQRFASDDIGDFIIRRANGATAFFFSNAIDDALMGVTLVLRGDDHLANTPRQLLILDALGLPSPQYAHVALLLGLDGAPLSSRHGESSVHDLRRRGFFAAAVTNHLVRLGHDCATDDWLAADDMIAVFELARLGRAAAKFDLAELRLWQRRAVARLSDEDFVEWVRGCLPLELATVQAERFAGLVRHDVELPVDVQRWGRVICDKRPAYSEDARIAIRKAPPAFFAVAAAAFARTSDLATATAEILDRTGCTAAQVHTTLRAALTGDTHGPELGELIRFWKHDEVLRRLAFARRAAE